MKDKKIAMIIGMIVISTCLPLIKADVHTTPQSNTNDVTQYTYLSDTELIITYRLSELLQNQITTEKGDFTKLDIPGLGFIGAIGSPQVPALTRICAVPTHQLAFEVLQSHVMETRTIEKLYPVQNPQSDDSPEVSDFVFDEAAYQQDVTFPEHVVEIIGSGEIRDIPFIKIQFHPVQYNPYQHIATIYDTITVQITFTQSDPVIVESNYIQKQFYNFYGSVFNNWPGFIANTAFQQQTGLKDTGCDYLIITHQDFYYQAQEFAEWKQLTGLLTKTVNVSDIGTTYTQIRQYIQDAYNSWAPRPSYILLLGDAEYVPTTYVNGVPTDLWYTTVDGTDYYPDIFIGRIPADTADQADVMIQKTITYEKTPPTLPSFYNNFVAAAYFQDDDTNGYEDRRFVLTSEEVRDYLLSQGHNGQRIYVTGSDVNPTHYNSGTYANGEPLPPELLRPTFAWDGDAEDICSAIQQGIFILNHRDHGMQSGWGDPYFTISDFGSFSNGELLPVVFSINCESGKFDTGECFCEEFLKKDDGGAIACYGATAVSYSGYNDYLCRGFYDCIWPEFDTQVGTNVSLYHLGEILNYGKMFMAETWGDPWGEEEYTFELFHCFGDPSLDMFTALPGDLEVTSAFFSDVFQVTVEGNSTPVQGARVCISQESGFYQFGITDAAGFVELDLTGAIEEELISISVTAHNYLYYNASFMLNQKPTRPGTPTGQTEGKPHTTYLFKSSTTDPDGDNLFYNFSWGDGTYSGWVGPYNSGTDAFAQHSWDGKGTFNVMVKAMDVKGGESEWSESLPIVMPLKYPFTHPILQWIYQIILNRFPLVSTLLQTMI
jgi:hypothetical protein